MGFESIEDVTEIAIESVESEGWSEEISEEWIHQTVKAEYQAHLKASHTWQHPTDTVRIGEVFDNLCRKKIIALHNAGVTQSDAISDVREIYNELEEIGIQPIGYCYYHEQDLQRVIEPESGNSLIGFYGVDNDDQENALQVGHMIVEQLNQKGFTVRWDQTAGTRIEVENVRWEKVYKEEEDEKWGHDRVFELMKG
jgi:hypothetical protein